MWVSDEGYFFGIGAFETIAVEQGHPVLLEHHYERLMRALDFLGISQSLASIRAEVERVLRNTEMQTGRKVLKVTVSTQNTLVSVRENMYSAADYRRGFRTATSGVRRNETSPLTYHKTLNYGDCLMEKRRAKTEGVDEPVFLNTKGMICEGATTNVFFVKNGRLITPSVESGILPGIIREYICNRCEVEQREIVPEEAVQCEEMFLTNSLLGVMPVQSYDGHIFTAREKGDALLQMYCRECMGDLSFLL